jgi:hypothetical protein
VNAVLVVGRAVGRAAGDFVGRLVVTALASIDDVVHFEVGASRTARHPTDPPISLLHRVGLGGFPRLVGVGAQEVLNQEVDALVPTGIAAHENVGDAKPQIDVFVNVRRHRDLDSAALDIGGSGTVVGHLGVGQEPCVGGRRTRSHSPFDIAEQVEDTGLTFFNQGQGRGTMRANCSAWHWLRRPTA